MINKLKDKILSGYEIKKEEALNLYELSTVSSVAFEELCNASNEIRIHFCGNSFDICTIINGKSGRCSENCKYCAQSAHYPADTESYPLLSSSALLEGAKRNHSSGILRYSIVTSGRALNDAEIEDICHSYKIINEKVDIALCASHGLLNYEQLVKLKEAGVTRYHNNLETSRRNFPSICTTHTYDDKINTIKAAQKAGLTVCSGGIMGLGETMTDRIDMAFELKELGIKSVPINILTPIPHTPFENNQILSAKEVQRIVSIYRFILPDVAIRMAGGRGSIPDKGLCLFSSGANAAISGDMLTTSGINTSYDMNMLHNLGYIIGGLE